MLESPDDIPSIVLGLLCTYGTALHEYRRNAKISPDAILFREVCDYTDDHTCNPLHAQLLFLRHRRHGNDLNYSVFTRTDDFTS